MRTVSQSADDEVTDRPWPAPGPDATWWRSEPADATEPADAEDAEDAGPGAQAGSPPARVSPFASPPVIRGVRLDAHPAPATPSHRTETPPAVLAEPAVPADLERDPPANVALPVGDATVDSRPIVVPAQRQPEKAMRPPRARPARPARPPRNPMRPWLAMPALVVLSLLTAFFAWVSAEPFWLAVGHGAGGVATILPAQPAATSSDPAGWRAHSCRASFIAEGGAFTVSRVVLAGVTGPSCRAGTRLAARMVSADGERAYPVGRADLNLRSLVGLLLILLCGLAIMAVTGALRFAGWRRVATAGLSLAAPLLVTLGILIATF